MSNAHERQIKSAFVHPKGYNVAFELSPQQIARFFNLEKSEDTANSSNAEDLFPFTQEPFSLVEDIWIRRGDAPVHIYKNNYDRVPPIRNSGCLVLGKTWI